MCGRGFATRVIGNYVEAFGTSAASAFYNGIDFSATPIADNKTDGVVICGNNVHVGTSGSTTSTLTGIVARASSGATGDVLITSNEVDVAGTAGKAAAYIGISLQCQSSSAILNAVSAGHNVTGNYTTNLQLQANGGTLNHSAGV